MKSFSGGGDGEAFLALSTNSVWFKAEDASMSQSVSKLEAMVSFVLSEGAGDCHSGKSIATKRITAQEPPSGSLTVILVH